MVGKVEHQRGVDGLTEHACLEVKVRTVGLTCVAAKSDGVASTYNLAFCHNLFAQVTIEGLKSIGVANHDVVAVAATVVLADAHLAVESCTDGVTNVHLHVQAFMLTSPTGTEGRVNLSAWGGHAETTEVNLIVGWHRASATTEVVCPVCVDIGCGVVEVSKRE